MATTPGIARESLERVRNAMTLHQQVNSTGLSVSEISRECGDLARGTVYKALEMLEATKDSTFYPTTYKLPMQADRRQQVEALLDRFTRTPQDEDAVRWAADEIMAVL